jgi:hypothetical protein
MMLSAAVQRLGGIFIKWRPHQSDSVSGIVVYIHNLFVFVSCHGLFVLVCLMFTDLVSYTAGLADMVVLSENETDTIQVVNLSIYLYF